MKPRAANSLPRRIGSRLALLGAALGAFACDAVVDTSPRDPCSSHAQCTQRFGEPSSCIDSHCVKLLSEECTEVLPAGIMERDNVILFGFMGALRGDFASYGTPTKEGAQLAFEEIEKLANGIPGAENQEQRHIGMLVCDHGADPKKVARHLAYDAKVPAIIGPSFSGVTLSIFQDVARPAGVLVISPSATSPAITDTPDDGLLWRTAPSDVVQTELLKLLTVEVVAALKSKGVIKDRAPRIAIPYKDDSAGRGLQLAATTMSDGPNAAPAIMAQWQSKYPNPETDPVDWASLVNGPNGILQDPPPDIIVALGTSEFVNYMMFEIEQNWPSNVPPPWYLLPEGDRVPELTQKAGANPDLKLGERVIGTAPGARRSTLYPAFADRFGGTFNHREPGNLAEFAYDAAYLLAYAIAISRQPYPTGRELAEALTNVSCDSNPVPAGPSRFAGNFATAARSQCINFEGVSGPLQFNPDTGEAVSDIAMWCLRKRGEGVSYDPPLDSYYSAEQSAIVQSSPPLDLTQPDWCGPVQ